ncbi:hypothetical protein B0H14DRAFT_3882322 [Mycena olivaceomarginata]|nr:hypothetical protein B0H14DRAFT_3882322 [Mycena olivaceomarginata]
MPTYRNQIIPHAIASRTKQTSSSFRHAAQTREIGSAQKKGSDLAPTRPGAGGDTLSSELLPKAFARMRNAAQVRADFRSKRKPHGEDGDREEGNGQKKGKIDGTGDTQIRPEETLAHFNKCVGFPFPFYASPFRVRDESKRCAPLVRSAIQSSLVTVRAQDKKGAAATELASSAAPTNSKTLKSAPASKSKSTPANVET